MESILKKTLDELTHQSSPPILESYNEIILDEAETEEALRKGREEKHYRLKRIAYAEELRKDFKPLEITSDQFFMLFKTKYVIDDDNEDIITNLCLYFTSEPAFKGDLKKGLLLVGGVGIGKSTLMQFFKQNPKYSYRLIS